MTRPLTVLRLSAPMFLERNAMMTVQALQTMIQPTDSAVTVLLMDAH